MALFTVETYLCEKQTNKQTNKQKTREGFSRALYNLCKSLTLSQALKAAKQHCSIVASSN